MVKVAEKVSEGEAFEEDLLVGRDAFSFSPLVVFNVRVGIKVGGVGGASQGWQVRSFGLSQGLKVDILEELMIFDILAAIDTAQALLGRLDEPDNQITGLGAYDRLGRNVEIL